MNRALGALVNVLLGAILIIGLLIALLAGGAPEGGYCLIGGGSDNGECSFKLGLSAEYVRWYVGVSCVAGLILMMSLTQGQGGPLTGAVAVLLGVVAAASLAPPILVREGGGAVDKEQTENAADAAEAVLKNARTIILEGEPLIYPSDESADNLIELKGGVAAVKFSLTRETRLRIVVKQETVGDPFLDLYRLEALQEDGRSSKKIERRSSVESGYGRIQTILEAGDYLLFIKNLGDSGALESGLAFRLEISEVSAEAEIAQWESLIPKELQGTLTLGASSDCTAEPSSCRTWTGVITRGQAFARDLKHLVKLETGGADACLTVTVSGAGEKKSRMAVLLADVFSETARSSFAEENESMARIIQAIDGEDETQSAFLVTPASFEGEVGYTVDAIIAARNEDGGCADAAY